MWGDDLQYATRLRNAMQFVNKAQDVGNMFNDVTANDLFEFIVGEGIRKHSQIMNHICMTQSIRIDTDRSRKLVLTTTDIKDLLLR